MFVFIVPGSKVRKQMSKLPTVVANLQYKRYSLAHCRQSVLLETLTTFTLIFKNKTEV